MAITFRPSMRSSAISSQKGVITFVALPTTVSLPTESAGETRSAFAQGYAVRFDGDDKP